MKQFFQETLNAIIILALICLIAYFIVQLYSLFN